MSSAAGMAETQYAPVGDIFIAYQVVGDGPFDLVFAPTFFSNIEVLWESPMVARFLRRLASFSRLILFDRRGSGLSDACPIADLTLENRAADIVAVLDAIGSDRAALFGSFLAGSVVTYLAATKPERVSALVLLNCSARIASARAWMAEAHSGGQTDPQKYAEMWGRSNFGLEQGISDRHADWWQRYQRMSIGPRTSVLSSRVYSTDDVRELLPSVRAPTLVLHRVDGPAVPESQGRYLASHIEGARFLEVPAGDSMWFLDADNPVLDEVQEFLIGSRAEIEPDRAIATVMFTDLVDSTRLAASAGDARWRDDLETHDRALVALIERHGGRLIKTTGDGVLATFDRPSTAIRCGRALTAEAERLGFGMRIGLHTGEIEERGDDITGLAVVIAARTMAFATANEIMVTSTVRDLVVGSSVSFEDAGIRELKGVPGEWPTFRVAKSHR
jgi:class 3 adenylate cyclase